MNFLPMKNFFNLSGNCTSVRQEFRAGFTTFLTMMYIVPVNAFIMSKTGMSMDALLVATALITIFASIFNGLWANTPVAMSVGMDLNAYFTFGLVLGLGIPWQTALGVVFVSGFLFLLLSFSNFRVWVVSAIPLDLRRAISAGIGVFISFIGLQQMGLIVHNQAVLVGLGNLRDANVLLGLFGLVLILGFWVRKVKGMFILAIVIVAILSWILGISPYPQEIVSLPSSIKPILGQFDVKGVFQNPAGFFSLALLPVVFTFLITDLFGSIGTLTGIGSRAKLFDDSKQGMRKMTKTLEADAVASVAGSVFGVSTTTAFIESASGVEEGGRTGLTAVFTGLLFCLTLFFLPLFKAIPGCAIYPVLVIVGVLMFRELAQVNFKDSAVSVATFFIVVVTPLSYSITNGLAFGFLSYITVKIFNKEWQKISWGMVMLSVISMAVFILH